MAFFRNIITRFAMSVAAASIALSTMAIDLPVKNINGKEYYYYEVTKNESVYSVVHRLGISQSDIVKYNPSVVDGLRQGQILYFPVADFGSKYGGSTVTTEYRVHRGETLFSIANKFGVSPDAIQAMNPKAAQDGIKAGQTLIIPGGTAVQASVGTTVTPVDPGEARLKPVSPAVTIVQSEDNERDDAALDNASNVNDSYISQAAPDRELNVVVCLPFMLGTETPARAATYATDFYRGFLLGIDSLKVAYPTARLRITAIDSGESEQPFNALTANKGVLSKADFIVSPDALNRLEELGKFGLQNQVYVFNTAQTRDSTWMTNPYMIQGNIPQAIMFDKAIDAFIGMLDGATPVFLDNAQGAHDKQAFVNQLTARLAAEGIDYKNLKYNNTMTSSAIIEKLPVEGADYVFVPLSGSLNEFHKFATALTKYSAEVASALEPGRVRLFGYPEYIRFNGDSLDKLHKIGTTFYSRFYHDASSPDSEAIQQSYLSRYGGRLPEGVPNQALYGFDLAHWLLEVAAFDAKPDRELIDGSGLDNGAQMNYRFQSVPGGGIINDALYIVTLNPGPTSKVEVL